MTVTSSTIVGWETRGGYVYGCDVSGELEKLTRGPESPVEVEQVLSWRSMAAKAARLHRVPTSWILAVMHRESSGNPSAISNAGAVGLMQILPTTAALYGVTVELPEPATNIELGAMILRDLSTGKTPQMKWDLAATASMYNAGPAENPIRPKSAPSKPFGYAHDPPYIFDVCALNNYYRGTGSSLLPAVAGIAALYAASRLL